jgi:hypothetical protein
MPVMTAPAPVSVSSKLDSGHTMRAGRMINGRFVPNATVPAYKRVVASSNGARAKLSPEAFEQRVVAKRQARETVSLGTNLSDNTFAAKLAARRAARKTAAIGTKADVVDTFESKLAARRAARRAKAVDVGCNSCGGTCGGNKSDADDDEDDEDANGGQKMASKGFESDSDSDSGSISF